MLAALKQLLTGQLEQASDPEQREHTLKLATAALLVEISRSDSQFQAEEKELIESQLRQRFDLNEDEAALLIGRANDQVEESVSLYEFTRPLNEELTREERTHILELLWEVAFADGVLDKYEEYYVRKIAELLYISQKDYIQTKHRAGVVE